MYKKSMWNGHYNKHNRVYYKCTCNCHHYKYIKECIMSVCVTVTIINKIKSAL